MAITIAKAAREIKGINSIVQIIKQKPENKMKKGDVVNYTGKGFLGYDAEYTLMTVIKIETRDI